ncbi:MAG: putative nucleotide-diphospho-sugar transferase [Candidatus Nanoarchaeia archaeon]|jgi:hypothetical protein|nr:putative nucleotide-diphospho-sugar transferase [Candidatus Nanoarchaeia archaeon]
MEIKICKENCIFTSITNDKDKLVSEYSKLEDWDYICFTDDVNIKSDFWDVVYIPKNEDFVDNIKVSKYYKTNFFKQLSCYKKLFWKDANIRIIKNFKNYIENLDDNFDIVFVKHPYRKSILEEFSAVLKYRLENKEMIEIIKKRYSDLNYNYSNGLIAGGAILFKNNERTIKFFKEWWEEIKVFSHRDQLSANFVLSKNPELKYRLLDFDVFRSKYFKIDKHNK